MNNVTLIHAKLLTSPSKIVLKDRIVVVNGMIDEGPVLRVQLRGPSTLGGISLWDGLSFRIARRLGHIRIDLLLHRLFHTDSVHHQLQVGQDFRLVAADVALDRLIGQQLGEVALGNDQTLGP